MGKKWSLVWVVFPFLLALAFLVSAIPQDFIYGSYGKVYNPSIIGFVEMFPSDPLGSLDDFFSSNLIVDFGGFSNEW